MYINRIANYDIAKINIDSNQNQNLLSNFDFDKHIPLFGSNTRQINKNIFDEFKKVEKPFFMPIISLYGKTGLKSGIFNNFPCSDLVNIKGTSFNSNVNQLYDEVYEIVKKQNYMFDELNITKPKLKLESSSSNTNIAGYAFPSNTILLEEKTLKDDYYICYLINKSGDRIPVNICSQDNLDKFKTDLNLKNTNYTGTETIKLSEQEKKLWIESTLAHELRHCLQSHIEASVGKSNKYLEYERKLVTNSIQSKMTLAELQRKSLELCSPNEYNSCKAEYNKILNEIESDKTKYSYVLNFKPNKILDSDAKLKFSINPNDKRYWSVENHLIKSALNYTNEVDKIYYSSPNEIDAYHYQMEFIFSQSHNNKYRNDSILAMGMALKNQYEDGLINLKKNGFIDFIIKN